MLKYVLLLKLVFATQTILATEMKNNGSSNQSCLKILSHFLEKKSRSLNYTETKELDAEVIPFSQYSEWENKDWFSHARRTLKFEDHNSELLLQEILFKGDFSTDEQKLIDKILLLAKSRKYMQKGYYEELQYVRSKHINRGIEAHLANEMARDALKRELDDGVEVGAFKAIFSDGTSRTVMHTSFRYGVIKPDDYLKALTSVLKDQQLADIRTLQFFHNHPGEGGTLSFGDLKHQRFLINYFQKEDAQVGVHFYAITERGEKVIVFHSGAISY